MQLDHSILIIRCNNIHTRVIHNLGVFLTMVFSEDHTRVIHNLGVFLTLVFSEGRGSLLAR